MDTKPKKSDEVKIGPATIGSSVSEGPSSLAEQTADLVADAEKTVARLDGEPEEKPNPKAWYEIRLIRRPVGPRRRKVRIGPSFVVMDAKLQEEPEKGKKAPDLAKKILLVDANTIAELKKDSDYVIREVPSPEAKPLGSGIGRRTIGEGTSTLTPAKES